MRSRVQTRSGSKQGGGPPSTGRIKGGRRHTATAVHDDEDEEEQCPICYDDLRAQGKKRLLRSSGGLELLDCGHSFCRKCIQTYVSKAINDGSTTSGK